MAVYEFKLLTEDQQNELVWSEGDFVADRQENDCQKLAIKYRMFSKLIVFTTNSKIIRILITIN